MSATVGLERLPGTIASLLDAATCNLLAAANELDTLVHHGGPAPLRAIETCARLRAEAERNALA